MFTADEMVSSYSRADAIADGDLIDVSSTAKEAGIRYPVALSRAVWARYVEFDAAALEGQGQSVSGRLWDVLWMFRSQAKNTDGAALRFRLHVAKRDAGDWQTNEDHPEPGTGLTRETHRLVTLKAIIGPGDTAAPVITILTPDED